MLRDGLTNCSHVLGVCIGRRHTCGFKNDSLGENFCNGNRCSFPLMVRCGAVLLYLQMFYMEKALLLRDISMLWYPWDLFGSCHVLLQIENSDKTQNLVLVYFDPSFFSPKRKKLIISDFIMASVRLGLVRVRIGL